MSTLNNIKKMGRPVVDSEAITVRLQRPALDRIDAWRTTQPDTPGRPEAIRRLIEQALGG